MRNASMLKTVLWIVAGVDALALLLVGWVYPEVPTAIYTLTGVLLVCLAALAKLNQVALKDAVRTRSLRYGANAAVAVVLVLAILVVVNVLNYNHYYKKDLTKDQIYGLSDQTVKLLKGLRQDMKVTAFVKLQARDQAKSLLDNYAYHAGGKFKAEYVDPDRDPTRAKAAGVKKYGTVIIEYGKKETRVEEVTEEKITNGLIKALKDKSVTVCFLSGHGEKSLDQNDAEGFSQVKQNLTAQSYETKTVSLLEEGKVPESCSMLAVMGPNKGFFEKEITVLKSWLAAGGHALFALDPNVKGGADFHPELTALLSEWSIEVKHNLVIDPTSRLLGVDAAVPIVALYNKEHPITKDFQVTTLFPVASQVEIKSGAPATLKNWWLAKSTPKALAKSDFKEIASGQVKLDPKKDQPGPHALMVAVEGAREPVKDAGKGAASAPAAKPARIVAMGTSAVAINGYARQGANLDLFLNAISWLADDENLISIRPKQESTPTPTLSQTEGRYVQLFTMVLVPGSIMLLGLGQAIRRRRL